jgi:hypothetical protein
METIKGVPTPGVRTQKSVVVLACLMHATAFAYIMLFTRDRADWTIGVFYKYASLMHAGHVPYRDFAIEYPPLAAVVFWLPRVAVHTLVAYRVAFALEIFIFDLCGAVVALWARARFAPRIAPGGVVLAQPLWLMWAGRSLVFDRFDLATAVLMLLAIALFVDRHERLAWVVIGLATALKLYPLVVTPLLALATGQRRRRDQAVGDAAAFLAAILVPSVVVAHGDLVAVAAFLKYHIARGLEIETVYASALMLGRLMGHHVSQTWGYGGNEIVAPLAPLLTSLTLPLTVLALGAVYRVAWRRRHRWADTPALVDDLARLSAAAVLAFMLAGKVLSPQYLLWLYPLLPLLGRRRLRAWGVFGVALLLSQWIFPEHYYQLVLFKPREIGVLMARNVLLLALGAILLTPSAPARGQTPSAEECDARARC